MLSMASTWDVRSRRLAPAADQAHDYPRSPHGEQATLCVEALTPGHKPGALHFQAAIARGGKRHNRMSFGNGPLAAIQPAASP